MKKVSPIDLEKSEKVGDEALDSLNADVRQGGPRAAQRHIEANIEEKARRRRASEKPAASGFKKSES